ncbi:hypothetical protein [Actinoplanes sp. NPDC026619]|uniref:hypothetical protein n=1 Tax=Actinoplanes sp. NPDC026619 TaxID=3155798 RepID=UPI0033FF768D
MRRGWIIAVSGAAVLAIAGGLSSAHAEEAPARAEVVTLPTGERVFLGAGDRAVRGVEPATATAPGPVRVRTMAVGDHLYVVPGEAMPYLGHQLDLALFDVLAPVADTWVEWVPGVAPHAVPGLDLEPAAGGRSAARIADPAAFGAALAGATPLAGVRGVHAAGVEPTAAPQYPIATLTVHGLDALGAPAFSGGVSVTNAEDVQRFSSLQGFTDGEVSFSVPVGHYSLEVSITTYDAENQYVGDAILVFPEVDITGTQADVTADARTARTVVPVPATPDPAELEQLQATYSRVSAAGTDSTTAYLMIGGSPSLTVTPTAPVTIGEVHWYTYFRLNSPAAATDPYLYDLVFPSDDRIPARFPDQVPATSLATLDATYAAEAGPARVDTYRASFQPWEMFPIRFASSVVAPLRRTEFVSALPDVSWIGIAIARPDEADGVAQSPLTTYRPGQRAADHYFTAPAVPGTDRGTVRAQPCPACRQGDQLLLNLQPWTDAGGHAVRMNKGETTTRVYADDALVATGTVPAGAITIPAGASRLRLELDTALPVDWITTATRVQTAWSWPAAEPTGTLPDGRTCAGPDAPCAFQPLLFAEYDAGADLTNAIPAGTAAPLTVTLRHQALDPAPAADDLTLEVSGDDGATWTPVPATAAGGGRFTATVTPDAGFLSLRVHATDPLGGTLDQTVVRALRVLG